MRKARYENELLAAEYARVMLEKHIYAALDPATDPALAAKLRNDVMNRGSGKVREAEGEDGDKKAIGGGAIEFLEALAAISTRAGLIERTPPSPAPRIERDVGGGGTDEDLQQLLDDLDDDENPLD